MPRNNYSDDESSIENFNPNDKYSVTGESEFSRSSTVPYDQDEVLSERHYVMGHLEDRAQRSIRRREEAPLGPFGFQGLGPKGYKRSDETIKEDVSEALYRSSSVDASDIEVFVENGIVTLKGSVTDRAQKKEAQAVIENLAGVEDVNNDLFLMKDASKPTKLGRFGLTNNITGLN